MTDDLIERLERAEKPCRELDVLIARDIDWRQEDWKEGDPTVKRHIEKQGLEWMLDHIRTKTTIWERVIPRFTSSIDAALTLVPEGASWDLRYAHPRPLVKGESAASHASIWRPGYKRFADAAAISACAATPALAICIAALRAKRSA